jgi:hypothetical protein
MQAFHNFNFIGLLGFHIIQLELEFESTRMSQLVDSDSFSCS